jgi:hypothetical protein
MLKAAASGAPRALPALARAFVAVALLSGGPRFVSAALAPDPLGWRLGVAAWSFKNFTFHEAIDRTASHGQNPHWTERRVLPQLGQTV